MDGEAQVRSRMLEAQGAMGSSRRPDAAMLSQQGYAKATASVVQGAGERIAILAAHI